MADMVQDVVSPMAAVNSEVLGINDISPEHLNIVTNSNVDVVQHLRYLVRLQPQHESLSDQSQDRLLLQQELR